MRTEFLSYPWDMKANSSVETKAITVRTSFRAEVWWLSRGTVIPAGYCTIAPQRENVASLTPQRDTLSVI
jgi:hypothetical protein